MKNIYTKLRFLTFLTTLFINSNLVKSQVYAIGNGQRAFSVSNDGEVVTLNNATNNYYWTKKDGVQQLGELAVGTYNSGRPIVTEDGKKIAVFSMDPKNGINQMAIFNLVSNTWNYLGGLGVVSEGKYSSPYGISSNGEYVSGIAYSPKGNSHAVIWSEKTGIIDLETKEKGSSRANGISDDGRIAVGSQDLSSRAGAYWEDGIQYIVSNDKNRNISEFVDVSRDGKWMIGSNEGTAIRYSKETGIQAIEHPKNKDFTYIGVATAINKDGSVIVGYYNDFPGTANGGEGFIWTEKTGRVELNEYVKSLGYDDLGIIFSLPLGISKDGTKIVGLGRTNSGENVSFLISLSAPPNLNTADFNKLEFEVYPNPVTNVIQIKTKGKVSSSILYNMSGQKVLSSEKTTIDVSSLPKGVYILKTTIDRKDVTKKIIKK